MYEKLISVACVTTIIIDGFLQIYTKYFDNLMSLGLKPYFKQHGILESLSISAGLTTIFYIIYLNFLKLPIRWYYLGFYGILIDLLFRKFSLFAGLNSYYTSVNYFLTALFAFISNSLPVLIVKMI